MDERRDLVDREELRRRIVAAIGHSGNGEWLHGYTVGKQATLNLLDAMPAVECPRGWTRDEVLAELDADPDAVCEGRGFITGQWYAVTRPNISRWHPEVRRHDVRVVRAPEPEWVPLTQLVGRTIDGCHAPVSYQPVHHTGQWWWQGPGGATHAFPEGTLNLVTGQVAVRPKAAG